MENDDYFLDPEEKFEFVSLNYFWITCLGLAGLLDLMACLLPSLVASLQGDDDHADGENILAKWIDYEDIPPVVLDGIAFLDKYTVSISFVFSVVWFVDTFWEAQACRQRILREEEKRYYLAQTTTTTITGDGTETAQNNDKKDSLKGFTTPWWKTANFVYYRIICLQLLLLPVGFYMLLYHTFNRAVHGQYLEDINEMEESITIEVVNEDYEVQYDTITTRSKRSLLFAIGHYFLMRLSGHTERAIRRQIGALIKAVRPKAIRTVFGRALRNPRRFKRRIGHLLTALRWIKYLAPLIGALNKLKGNVQDMVKKWKQRRVAEKQKRIRQILWGKISVEVQEEEAARMIQAAFRAYQARKATTALMAFQGDQRYLAALKLQQGFRRAMDRARENLRLRREDYRRLAQRKKQDSQSLSQEEKQQFYELQDEFAHDAHILINRKLLMRPNTRFSVIWKILFVFCVTIEISQLVAKPWLDSYKENRRDEPMSMAEFIAISFVPTRASHLAECGFRTKKKGFPLARLFRRTKKDDDSQVDEANMPFYCYKPTSIVQEAFSDVVSLLLVPAPVAEWPDCQPYSPPPRWRQPLHRQEQREPTPDLQRWFCVEPYRSAHGTYRKIFDFLLEEFLILVSLVCFLDVFVTFFTGELDELTGSLVPKPFFVRWILPGLLLQLAINPSVDRVGEAFFGLWGQIIALGPVRVYRWAEAVFYPTLYYCWVGFIRWLWIPLVKHQNEVQIIITSLV